MSDTSLLYVYLGSTARLPQKTPEAWPCTTARPVSLLAALLLHNPSRFLIRQPLAGLLMHQVPEVSGLGHVVRRRAKRSKVGDARVLLRRRDPRQRCREHHNTKNDDRELSHDLPPLLELPDATGGP